ncbi:MAG: LysR family transcriptional regulator [Firmicutes bacterium]|nr:LysR family transcriptional regulator [Bacillota bacterium]
METRIAATFIKVAELGSITKAADQLGYSQGAVTSQIKQLEKDLGVLLFDRIGRGIQLTEAGRNFRKYAVRLVRASEDADAFAMDKKDPEGQLVIEATSSASIGILPKVLYGFHERYPKIKLSVRLSEDTDILVSHVRQNRVDFAVFLAPKENYDGCTLVAERKEEFQFVTSPSDRLAENRRFHWKTSSMIPLFLHSSQRISL